MFLSREDGYADASHLIKSKTSKSYLKEKKMKSMSYLSSSMESLSQVGRGSYRVLKKTTPAFSFGGRCEARPLPCSGHAGKQVRRIA